MHACLRSVLILAAMLAGLASPAVAGDMPMAPLAGGPSGPGMPASAQAPDAAPTGRSAFPTLTAPGEPIAPGAEAPASGAPNDPMAIEDEEAPAADVPAPEPFAVHEPQAAGGPKSATDKIVDKFMLLDTDASRTVSMQEYLVMVQQRVQARFEAMDTNRDGEISEAEYRSFWKSRMARWYRLQR